MQKNYFRLRKREGKYYVHTKRTASRDLAREKADRPPCICPGGMMNMVTSELMQTVSVYLPEAHTDAKKMAKLAQAVYDEKCFENYGVPFCMTIEAEEMGAIVDLGSDIYEPHVIQYAIDSVTDFQKLHPIDLTKGRAQVVLEAIRILKSETKNVPIVGNLTLLDQHGDFCAGAGSFL